MRHDLAPPATRPRRGRRLGSVLAAATLVAGAIVTNTGLTAGQAAAQPPPAPSKGPVGWDTYRDGGSFAQLRGTEQSRQFSSFDRAGGNDDGFEGTYSCLRKTNRGCVIAERAGAGEISSMWFTREPYGDVTGTGKITVELDGKVVLDAPLIDVVGGRLGPPFSWPLVGNANDASGGAVVKVPMPYRNSMRVTVQHNPNFYHVDYRTFPDAAGVRTFDPSDPATDVLDRLRRFGVADPKPPVPGATPVRRDFQLPPGGSTPVAELTGPGRINQLRLRIPQVVAAPQVVDDGRAYGAGGGSQFRMRVAPANQGVRIIRRFDPQVAGQVASMAVDGKAAGQWRSGAARPGEWGVQVIEVPPNLTAGKSSVQVANRYVSSTKDVNEFRYDVQSKVNGDWVRTDVLDLGPSHPGEESAHGYRISNPTFARVKLLGRYPIPPRDVLTSDELLNNTRLRITFDGRTTVDAPIGEFFGSGLGEHDVRNLMSSIDPGVDGWYTAWWPMPFSQDARVELVNTGSIPISSGTAEVTSTPADIDQNTAYFHATHHSGETVQGRDWNFLTAGGSGTFYGTTHSMRGLTAPNSGKRHPQPLSTPDPRASQRTYLEGDERFYLNGSASPAWHGTGSEDFYEAGWYFRDGTTFSMPLAGNPSHEMGADGCRYDCTGAYRLLVPEAVSFSSGLVAGIEHGPANDEPGQYSSTAYWYGGHPPSQRQVDDIDLASRGSRDRHGYQAAGERVAPLNSSFEGMQRPGAFTRDSTTATGKISFDLRVGGTGGVRLVRLADQNEAYQQVEVRVDGRPAGTWLQPLGNRSHRWLTDNFVLPAALTAGKKEVRVELIPARGAPPWSASRYTAFAEQ